MQYSDEYENYEEFNAKYLWWENSDIPVLNSWRPVKRLAGDEMTLERNPYYPFVDQEGNQLPYIDEISVQLANNQEMVRTKAATGQATFSGRHLQTKDIPLYMKNAENEGYNVHPSPFTSTIPISSSICFAFSGSYSI